MNCCAPSPELFILINFNSAIRLVHVSVVRVICLLFIYCNHLMILLDSETAVIQYVSIRIIR